MPPIYSKTDLTFSSEGKNYQKYSQYNAAFDRYMYRTYCAQVHHLYYYEDIFKKRRNHFNTICLLATDVKFTTTRIRSRRSRKLRCHIRKIKAYILNITTLAVFRLNIEKKYRKM